MRLNRSKFVLSGAALVVSGIAFSVPPAAVAAQCASTQIDMGRWSAVEMTASPSLPELGSSAIVASTVVGQDPSVVLATDGISVFRSTDGGCTWRTTYTMGAADYWSGGGIASAYSITSIVDNHSAAPANRHVIYLALSPNQLNVFTFVTLFGAAPPELFAVSNDGGQTFALVQSAPTVATPIVPECLSPPTAVVVPPANSRTIYLQCGGGLAQGAVDDELAGGGPSYIYRSDDGGRSWSLQSLPTYPQYSGTWFVPGPKPKELWMVGGWMRPNSHSEYLAVWHTTDNGAHWSMSTPAGKPGVGIGSTGISVDMTSGGGRGERVVTYAPIGVYETIDSGKHWTKLSGIDLANTDETPVFAFFVKRSTYVLTTKTFGCNPGAAIRRYAGPAAKPVKAPFPNRWGSYFSWGAGGSFAVVDSGSLAFGYATLCSPSGAAETSRFLTFRPR